MIPVSEALAKITFTREEERALAKLEAAVDTALRDKFDGAPLKLQFADVISPKIAAALQRKYEEYHEGGSWRVTVSADARTYLFAPFFAPVLKRSEPAKPAAALPPVAAPPALVRVAPGNRLLVRMPTRGRPAQALSVLEAYREMAGAPILIEVVIDYDDETMVNAEVLQRLAALGCTVTVGAHKSKVEACNGGRVSEWDILVLASDDMHPAVSDWAVRILAAMDEHFPHRDGAIHTDDGFQGPAISTIPVLGRRLYDQFQSVYAPQYQSLFCDTEQTELLKAAGRLIYVDEQLFEHRHHVWGRAPKDALYERNDAFWAADQAVFEARQKMRRPHAQWAFDSPPLWLSIGIATLPARCAQLERLLDDLYYQIIHGADAPREVEVLVDSREGVTVGEKRQALLERARGHFIAYVDDDDGVAFDYVSRVVGALRDNPTADCASLAGVMTTAGRVPERFEHSIKNREWYSKDGQHFRGINHLNAVRLEIARQVGFKPLGHAEDFDYSQRLRPLLKTEADTGIAPLYMYWYQPGKP